MSEVHLTIADLKHQSYLWVNGGEGSCRRQRYDVRVPLWSLIAKKKKKNDNNNSNNNSNNKENMRLSSEVGRVDDASCFKSLHDCHLQDLNSNFNEVKWLNKQALLFMTVMS